MYITLCKFKSDLLDNNVHVIPFHASIMENRLPL